MGVIDIAAPPPALAAWIQQGGDGERLVIAQNGTPVAALLRVSDAGPDAAAPSSEPLPPARHRLGFMVGQGRVPDDFDRMEADVVSE